MKKENGIIILDEILPNWQKAIQKGVLIPNELCGPHYNGYWLNGIEEKNWFLKISKKEGFKISFYMELLMEELARNLGIPTIQSEIVKYGKNTYGLISQSYLMPGYDIITGKEIISAYHEKDLNEFYFNSLEYSWESLESYFKSYPNKRNIILGIMKGLTERYVFFFFTRNRDFHAGNWELLVSNTYATLTPLYDMDQAFAADFEVRHNSMHATLNKDDIYEDFKEYYQSSSEYFKQELEREFSILTPEFIKISLENIEKKHGFLIEKETKEEILTLYENHYDTIANLIERSRHL